MIARATVEALKRVKPDVRVMWAARTFWVSLVLGVLCTVFVSKTGFERILMAISWGAITITAADIILTTDIRAEK